jgi:hypothetical protein
VHFVTHCCHNKHQVTAIIHSLFGHLIAQLGLACLALDEQQIARGYVLGAVDYLLKPYPPDAVHSKVVIYSELFKRTHALQAQFRAAIPIQDQPVVLVAILREQDCLKFLARLLHGLHVGGKTTLAWLGVRHNLSAHEPLWLWGDVKARI